MAWNRPSENGRANTPGSPRRGRSPRPTVAVRGLIAGLIVVVGAGVGAWALWPEGGTRRDAASTKRSLIREAKPAVVSRANAAAPAVATAPAKPVEHEYGKLVRSVTNQDGAVTSDYVDGSGIRRRVVTPPRQVWHNAVDQVIAMAISIKEGMTAAPFPYGITDDDFRKALKTEIVIYSDDSDELKDLKRRVRETKKEIARIMEEEGSSFSQIIEDHREQMNANTEMYNNALRGLAETRKNGTAEDVHKYLVIMNAALQQVGVKELSDDAHTKGKRK